MNLSELLRIIREHLDAEPLVLYIHGSRAYGYAHEGSDYDIRGIFIERNPEVYLSPMAEYREDARLEEPPYDIHLWELRKFVRLLVGYNPIVYELLHLEPIYVAPKYDRYCGEMLELSRVVIKKFPLSKLHYHYYGMFRSWLKYLLDKRVKKAILHVVRCFLAIAYMTKYREPPPIRLSDLSHMLREEYPEVTRYAEYLLERTRKGKDFDVSEAIVNYIRRELSKMYPPKFEKIATKPELLRIDSICMSILRRHICSLSPRQ